MNYLSANFHQHKFVYIKKTPKLYLQTIEVAEFLETSFRRLLN